MLAEIYLHSDESDPEDNGINFKVATKFMKKLHDAERLRIIKLLHTQVLLVGNGQMACLFSIIYYTLLYQYT